MQKHLCSNVYPLSLSLYLSIYLCNNHNNNHSLYHIIWLVLHFHLCAFLVRCLNAFSCIPILYVMTILLNGIYINTQTGTCNRRWITWQADIGYQASIPRMHQLSDTIRKSSYCLSVSCFCSGSNQVKVETQHQSLGRLQRHATLQLDHMIGGDPSGLMCIPSQRSSQLFGCWNRTPKQDSSSNPQLPPRITQTNTSNHLPLCCMAHSVLLWKTSTSFKCVVYVPSMNWDWCITWMQM